MRSFIAVVVVVVLAGIAAVPASAMPADSGPRPVAHIQRAAPMAPASDDGTPAFVFVLIGGAAVLAFGAGGYLGARSVTRQLRPRAS